MWRLAMSKLWGRSSGYAAGKRTGGMNAATEGLKRLGRLETAIRESTLGCLDGSWMTSPNVITAILIRNSSPEPN